MSIPLNISSTGPIPTSPTTLLSDLITSVSATNPDYTANLPGLLIEDVSSTQVAGMAQIDQARVDAVNSVTPYGANPFVLAQLGAQAGIPQGTPTNTSVYVTFTGLAGFVISAGFTVSDGSYQYIIQDGGIIQTGGTSQPLYAIASQSGTWAVPAGTVTQLITSVPTGYTLTCTNAIAGVPGGPAESVASYRSRVLQAGIVAAQGTPNFVTTLLQAIPNVQSRLVAVQSAPGGWEFICGGGDSYLIANAIYQGVVDLSSVVGSQISSSRNVTVTITDYPNTFTIPFVNPPQQTVSITATWNTNLPNFVGAVSVNQLAAVALQNYINGIVVGQPINELAMTAAFQNAVSSVLTSEQITALTFSVYINGALTAPSAGTSIINGDPESYFYAGPTSITVQQ
ncbi:MAG: baseplate J/gp47 family protein [Thiobacillus sp.]